MNGQYLCGMNTIVTNPDFGAQMVRATDYSLTNSTTYPCGGGIWGKSFDMGSGGEYSRWASDGSKLLINNSGNVFGILAFNSSTMQVTPSSLCGVSVLGSGTYAFSQANPHVIYEVNTDSESTVLGSVTSGAFVTPETVYQCSPAPCATGPHATLLAVNPAALLQTGNVSGGTANSSTTRVGQTSGAVFTPTATPTPYTAANTLYQGTINDATQSNPALWTVTYSLLFDFNYVAGITGDGGAIFSYECNVVSGGWLFAELERIVYRGR